MSGQILTRTRLILLAGVALVPFGVAPADADASLTRLGFGNYDGASGNGVSNDGTVAGNLNVDDNTFLGIYWTSSGPQYVTSGAQDVYLSGISSDGSTIVGTWVDVNSVDRAIVLSTGASQPTYLPSLDGVDDDANAADANGMVVVGGSVGSDGIYHAVTWSGANRTLTDLGTLGGNTRANGVSGDGTIVVGGGYSLGGLSQAFVWQGAGLVQIDQSMAASAALGISANKSTIVGWDRADPQSQNMAVKWDGSGYGTRTDLGTLGGNSSSAEGVNEDGSIIVGWSTLANNQEHAFRYANGTMSDLNTLLSNAGVNMAGIDLTGATAISANGSYIAANDLMDFGVPYLVYYKDGVGGLTTGSAQQASVDGLGQQRQSIAIQHDAYAGILTGDLDRQDDSNQVGAFGLYGSAVGGLRGHVGLGGGWSVSGGVADGTSEFDGAGIGNGLYGAVALRYDASDFAVGGFHPFGEAGGSYGLLNGVSMSRSHTGGTGTGNPDATLGSVFARFGLTGDFQGGDQLSFAGEIGQRWLSTDAYAETLSSSNPFPASIAAGTDIQTVAKFSTSWTHALSDKVDLTLRAAVGTVLAGSSGLEVATTGFGTLGSGIDRAVWGELGAHATWKVSDHSALDLYATSIFGQDIGANIHVGAGYHYQF